MACFSAYALLILQLVGIVLSQPTTKKLWVVYDENSNIFEVSSTEPSNYIASATLKNAINQTGWAKLEVLTNAGPGMIYSNSLQAYAAGFVEGQISKSLIGMHWSNTMAYLCPPKIANTSKFCLGLKKFLSENMDWMKENIKNNPNDPYWHHVQLYLHQISGLQDGYRNKSPKLNMDIDLLGMYLFQVDGDLEDLTNVLPHSEAAQEFVSQRQSILGSGHCSALVKLLPGNTDLYAAQDTWSSLSSMLRILKKYDFQFTVSKDGKEFMPGRAMTFSSYPGVLYSGDDFYTISSGLLTMETTIGNSNPTLQSHITPSAVLEGIRNMVANRLTLTAQDWAQMFAQHNSGTYNNQWMIIDYKRFQSGSKTPVPGTFYVLEQIPGFVHYDDMTTFLYNNRYFGSYNVAFFPDVFNKSGMPALVKKFGDWFTYDKTPRALIYQRDVPHVTDLKSMTKLMRYNNFKQDPLSRCNCTPPYSAENAIACRDDLNPLDGKYPFGSLGHRPHVATDMKLTNSSMFSTLSFLAVSGPTYDDLPAFQWSKSDYKDKLGHVGHPDLWKFPVIRFDGANPMKS